MNMKFKLRTGKLHRFNHSYYVTLPIEWIRHHDLRKGSELNLTLNDDGSLLIQTVEFKEADIENGRTTNTGETTY
jgi:phosphate uptake regulator